MNRAGVFSTSVLMAFGVVLLPSNVVAQREVHQGTTRGNLDVRLLVQPNFRTAVRPGPSIQKDGGREYLGAIAQSIIRVICITVSVSQMEHVHPHLHHLGADHDQRPDHDVS